MVRQLFVVESVMLILLVIAFAAVVRAVACPTGDRFAYLRIGMDELRLMGLGIVLTIAAFVAEIVAVLGVVMGAIACGAVAIAALDSGEAAPAARPDAPPTGW